MRARSRFFAPEAFLEMVVEAERFRLPAILLVSGSGKGAAIIKFASGPNFLASFFSLSSI